MRWRGVASVLLLVLAWLALDDITTDNATGGFDPEYSILVVCGLWFAGVAGWLLARRRPAPAGQRDVTFPARMGMRRVLESTRPYRRPRMPASCGSWS